MEVEILALDLLDVIRLVLLAILRQEFKFTGTWARSCLLFLFSRLHLHLHLHCRFGGEWLVPGPWMDWLAELYSVPSCDLVWIC